MKKVLINYIGKSGGGPAFALEFAKGLALNGCEVYAVMSEFVDNRKLWDCCELIKDVYYVKTNEFRGKKFYIKAQLEFILKGKRKLKHYFKDIEFDYVITTMQHLWSLDVSKLVNAKKIVWICHDPIPHSGSGKMDTYLGNRFAKIADETIVLTNSFIPVVSQRWGISKKHIHFMPHGRQKMYNQSELRKTGNFDKNINFLFFGYLREYKGLRILARAFKIIHEKFKNVTLTIAGSGNFDVYKSEFEGIKDVFVINRYIPDDEVGKFFSKNNLVVVMPYLDATQSGVSLIAMEFGAVIIASDTGGLKEQLDDGKIGLYCKPGDVDSLVEQMEKVITNSNIFTVENEKMKKYLDNLEWNKVTKKILEEL